MRGRRGNGELPAATASRRATAIAEPGVGACVPALAVSTHADLSNPDDSSASAVGRPRISGIGKAVNGPTRDLGSMFFVAGGMTLEEGEAARWSLTCRTGVRILGGWGVATRHGARRSCGCAVGWSGICLPGRCTSATDPGMGGSPGFRRREVITCTRWSTYARAACSPWSSRRRTLPFRVGSAGMTGLSGRGPPDPAYAGARSALACLWKAVPGSPSLVSLGGGRR